MRILKILFVLFTALLFTVNIYAALPDMLLSSAWQNDKYPEVHILFFKQGEKYFGKMFLSKDKDKIDSNNKDKSLRQRKLDGLVIIRDLKLDGDKLSGGTVYSADRGITASCDISLIDESSIQIKGSIAFISEKQKWKKVNK